MFAFRNGRWLLICTTYFLLLPCHMFAQPSFLKLSALVDSADHYLPRLKEKEALLKSASANVTDTRHQFLPFFRFNDQVNIGSDNSLPGSYYSIGIIPSTSNGIHPESDLQSASGNIAVLYGEYDLVDFGYKNARINQARSEEAFQGADFQREIYILNSQVSKVYFNLIRSQAKLEVIGETVRRYDTIFMMIHALTESGLKPGSDSSLAKAELSRNRITYNQVMEDVRNYREALSYLTGIPPAQVITDSSLLSEDNRRRIRIPASSGASNPLLSYFENLKNTYIANEKLISRSYLPKLMLTATSWARGSSITYNNEYKSLSDGLGYQRFNYLAGVSFQYDLFNGLHKKDRLKSYGFERQASELELEQQTLSLANAEKQAQNSIDIVERNLLELPVQYQAASDTYNQKVAQYKAGIISLIDLTNAAFVLDRSMNDYVETIAGWYTAQLNKAVANGGLAAFIQSIQ